MGVINNIRNTAAEGRNEIENTHRSFFFLPNRCNNLRPVPRANPECHEESTAELRVSNSRRDQQAAYNSQIQANYHWPLKLTGPERGSSEIPARGSSYSLFLTANESVLVLRKSAPPKTRQEFSALQLDNCSAL